ncbi:MAG: EamA family transporter [Firmicutes bacterium]|nr:EamA family transporter [Bacillota bacterium]
MSYIWPVALIVICNTFYQICAKSVPGEMNPFSTLIVTYGIGVLSSLILYFVTSPGGSLAQEMKMLNWAPFVLGLSIVGLEAGFIYAYKAGWLVSTLSIVQCALLTVALLVVGYLLYHEALTANKLIGIGICLVGLIVINYK